MSVPVGLDKLRQEVDRFGAAPYLITVGADGRPHAVAVSVTWEGDELATAAGGGTRANAEARPDVTLLWAPFENGGFSLIADGRARVAGEQVVVQPVKAVLHRPAECQPVLD